MGIEGQLPGGRVTRRAVLGGALAVASLPTLSRIAAAAPTFGSAGAGVDISWLPALEAVGGRFVDDRGVAIDPLVLLRGAGIKLVRLRLWVYPSDGHSGLTEVTTLAKRAHRAGLKVGIDLHYSDTWADPGHQSIPASWQALSYLELRQQVFEYTRDVIRHLVRHGVVPAFVQPGNEISNGLLWPVGQLNGDNRLAWRHVTGLLNSGIVGIRSATPRGHHIDTFLHLATTGDDAATAWFLSQAHRHELRPIDAVGLSYYPQWHGDLAQLSLSLKAAARVSRRPVVVAETAYPWSTATFAGSAVIDSSKLVGGYAATPAGQAAYVHKLWQVVRSVPARRGVGIWWWEGLARDVTTGDTVKWSGGMQNATLVDQNGRVLPALGALGSAR